MLINFFKNLLCAIKNKDDKNEAIFLDQCSLECKESPLCDEVFLSNEEFEKEIAEIYRCYMEVVDKLEELYEKKRKHAKISEMDAVLQNTNNEIKDYENAVVAFYKGKAHCMKPFFIYDWCYINQCEFTQPTIDGSNYFDTQQEKPMLKSLSKSKCYFREETKEQLVFYLNV